ncbi:MAG: hypothetical protein AAFY71_21485 [Bacteroidota bacterium]
MKPIFVIFFCLGAGVLTSCDAINPVACTLEFRTVSLEVIGGNLDQTYTIQDNGDTVLSSKDTLLNNFYTVLDDSFQEQLEGEVENFRFVGLIGDSVVVDEAYEIGADECHIFKESGATSVTL